MIDSDSGMSSSLGFSGSSSTDNLVKTMNEKISSSPKTLNKSFSENSHQKRVYVSNKPIIFEEVIEVKYKEKDDKAVSELLEKLMEKFSCDCHMTIFNDWILWEPRYAAVRFRANDKENLSKIVDEFKFEFNTLKTARLLNKFYQYESLNISDNSNSISATMVVPPFSQVKKVPLILAKELKIQCSISEEKKGLFSNKVIKFEAKGDSRNLECFKKIFENYLVQATPDKPKKRRI